MTTQAILFNMFGVALASDSATTCGNGLVQNAAEKVVALPHPHKLASLHAGQVWMQNVVHTQLVEHWAESIKDPLPHVADYAAHYLNWLATTGSQWIAQDAGEDDILYAIRKHFKDCAEFMSKIMGSATEESLAFHDIEQGCLRVLESAINELRGEPEPVGYSPIWANNTLNTLAERIDAIIAVVFGNFPQSPKFVATARDLAATILAHSDEMTPATITFVGYGTDDLAPALVEIGVGCFYNGVLLHRTGAEVHYEVGDNAYIGVHTIGHDSTIDLLLSRFNYETINVAAGAAASRLKEIEASLPDSEEFAATKASIHEARMNIGTYIYKKFQESANELKGNSLAPNLSGLPVATLAHIAHGLVSCEALNKLMLGTIPTVGGEIKAWTITKPAGCTLVNPHGHAFAL